MQTHIGCTCLNSHSVQFLSLSQVLSYGHNFCSSHNPQGFYPPFLRNKRGEGTDVKYVHHWCLLRTGQGQIGYCIWVEMTNESEINESEIDIFIQQSIILTKTFALPPKHIMRW